MVARHSRVVLALAALILLPASPASGHATMVETSPTDGSHLQAGPSEVTVTFDEPVEVPAGSVRVYDTASNRVDLGDAGHGSAPEQIRVTLPEGLADGAYVATWHAVSLDGHPVRGAFVFHVGHGDGVVDETLIAALLGEGGEVPFAAAGVIARWITYLAGLTAAGAAVTWERGFITIGLATAVAALIQVYHRLGQPGAGRVS